MNMTSRRQRVAELVRDRSGLAGHMLAQSDVDRLIATIERLPKAPASVLDVGCGTGVLVDVLAELGYTAIGLDPDEVAMAAMTEPHVVGSADAIPMGDGSYDAVVLNEVIEHLPVGVYDRALVEAARVARRRVVVTVPNAESLESASARCRGCDCIYSIHGHVRRFDARDMHGLLPGLHLSSLTTVGPYKLRHRTVEWYLRRRLLGRWPSQPGTECPQCGRREPHPGIVTGGHPSGSRVVRLLRWAYAFPWRRWWLVAQYDRDQM